MAVPAAGSVFAGRSQPNPTHSHLPMLHPKAHYPDVIQGTALDTDRGCARRAGDSYSTAWGIQDNSCASQVITKLISEFSCKNRRGKKIADKSMEPRHCRFEVCGGKKKKGITVLCFSFLSLKCHDLFPPKVFSKRFIVSKKRQRFPQTIL